MKVFIVLAAFVALSSAGIWPYRSGMNLLGAGEESYLQVCQSSVSKITELKVKQTLQTVSDNLEKLSEAIDSDNTAAILEVIDDSTKIMTEKIASFQGVIYAAIENAVGGGFTGDRMTCFQNLFTEFKSFHKKLETVAAVTKQAADKFKDDERFKRYFGRLNSLMVQVKQFIDDPSQVERLTSECERTNVPSLMQETIQTLDSLKRKLVTDDVEKKRFAVESATGLLMEGVTLNAICHAGQNINNNDQIKERVLRQDSKSGQNLANTLNKLAKYILGTPSFFRRIFGY